MAGTLPLVRTSAQALYPVTRRVEFLTDIAMALDGSEQRSKTRPPLTRIDLSYARLNVTDRNALQAFVESQKGSFDSTWSLALGVNTYSHLAFEDDGFAATEEPGSQTTYSVRLRARQTMNPGNAVGSRGAAFPACVNGLRSQLPYVTTRRFQVMRNVNSTCGVQYAWAWFSGGLTGFPTGSLPGWQLSYPVLSDADLVTLETHYREQWGCWSSFTFKDLESGTDFTKCRYADDVLEIVHQQPNVNSLTLRVMQTN